MAADAHRGIGANATVRAGAHVDSFSEGKQRMRTLIVGAGSTGGYFGGRLAQAGRDVTFLVRPARAESLRLNGLRIVSPHGDVALAPKIVTAGQVRSTYDVVVLAVKAFAIDAAMNDLAPAVGRGNHDPPSAERDEAC